MPRKTRVLIVDDSYSFLRAARDLLARRGYEIVGEARSAAAARDAVEELVPDAVLLGVTLPDGSGFEVCAELSDQARPPAVLLVSSHVLAACFAQVKRCGANGLVLKSQLSRCDLTDFWPPPNTATPQHNYGNPADGSGRPPA